MSDLIILEAKYGEKDCTLQVQSKVINNKLIIRSTNDIIGDSQPGVLKYLEIKIKGEEEIYKIKEGNLFIFPKPKYNKLGIFYSNNNNPSIYPAIQASLKSIQKTAEKLEKQKKFLYKKK
jgi:hypothetical protein